MKKIAILMYYMNCGGVEMALINLLKRIPSHEVQVDLYLLEKRGEFLERIPDYVNIIEMKVTPVEMELLIERNLRPVLKKASRLGLKALCKASLLSSKYLLFRFLKKEYHEYKAVFAGKAKIKGYDQVWDFHGYHSLTTFLTANQFDAPSKSFWIHCERVAEDARMYPQTMKHFDQVFAVSHDCAEIYNKIYADAPARVFHNFIDQDLILHRAEEKISLKESPSILSLVTVGRLSFPKGYDTALEVAKWLKNRGVCYKWYFIGGVKMKVS